MGIQIDQLAVAYGNTRVIADLSVVIPQGSFFTLLGPSGCGKTTLLRTLAGFIPVRAGRIHFGKNDVTHLAAHQRNIGMVFQDYALFPHLSVFDNVAYGLRARHTEAQALRKKSLAALERVGLDGFEDRLPAALSGGQRQRVALARALVIEPQVLLMDEPLSNLDAKLRVQVRETIASLQREAGITTVFVTHDQEEALALSDQIAVMQQGRIAQLGSPSEIYKTPCSGYVADFIGAANLLQIAAPACAAGPVSVDLHGTAVAAHAPQALAAAANALLVARPDDLGLVPADAVGAPGVPAQVHSKQYLGARTLFRVRLRNAPAAQLVQVDWHGDPPPEWLPGAAVRVVFDPRKTLLLAP